VLHSRVAGGIPEERTAGLYNRPDGTVVYRLEEKKAIRRTSKFGNAYVFEAVVSRDSAQHRMIDDLVALFGGRRLPIVTHLIESVFVVVNDYGPYAIATLICISLIAILWHQRFALLALFWSTQKGEPERSERTHWWIEPASCRWSLQLWSPAQFSSPASSMSDSSRKKCKADHTGWDVEISLARIERFATGAGRFGGAVDRFRRTGCNESTLARARRRPWTRHVNAGWLRPWHRGGFGMLSKQAGRYRFGEVAANFWSFDDGHLFCRPASFATAVARSLSSGPTIRTRRPSASMSATAGRLWIPNVRNACSSESTAIGIRDFMLV
jgi:hypothetical protein